MQTPPMDQFHERGEPAKRLTDGRGRLRGAKSARWREIETCHDRCVPRAPDGGAASRARAVTHGDPRCCARCRGVHQLRHADVPRQWRTLLSFAAAVKHCALYIGAHPLAVHARELERYDTTKGSVRFSPSQSLPDALVPKLVKTRVAECTAQRSARGRLRGVDPHQPG